MIFSADDAIALFRNWHNDGSWIYTQARRGSFGEHQFWAQVARVSHKEVCFAGKDTSLSIPLANCTFEHIGLDQIPEIVLQRFKEADCCLVMRFEGGAALIYGCRWQGRLVEGAEPNTGLHV
jgi:hypothetical protein